MVEEEPKIVRDTIDFFSTVNEKSDVLVVIIDDQGGDGVGHRRKGERRWGVTERERECFIWENKRYITC